MRLSGSLLAILFLLALSGRVSGDSCPPDAGARLGRSIERLQQFIARSRSAPSFNYDRLDYLLDRFGAREKAWALCGGPERSGQDRILRARLDQIRRRLSRQRSLPPGSSPAPASAYPEIERLFSGLPGQPLPHPSAGGSGNAGATPFGGVLNSPLVLLLVLFGGLLVLILALRGTLRSAEAPEAEEDPRTALRSLGARWARFRSGREEILAAMKRRLGRGRGAILLRAQLLRREPEGQGAWTVVDELVSDEGGQIRTFGEGHLGETLEESWIESALGDNETRTRAVIPLEGEKGEEMALVVDALTAPEIDFLLPDLSGLRSLGQMKEILFELSGKAGERETVGVISFFFDDPGKDQLLEGEGEEAFRDRSFVANETMRLAGESMAVFGDPPGTFHLVLSGWSETRTGMLIRKIADGLGPEAAKGEESTLEKPWYRKTLVAYTRWEDPDPSRIDSFLERIRGNLVRLRSHPEIGTVIDH